MGILSNFLKQKEQANNKELNDISFTDKNYDYYREINTIILIMDNLGILEEQDILKKIYINNNDFDISILYRLRIKSIEDISLVKKYYKNTKLGFGSDICEKIKIKLQNIIDSNKNSKNNFEIVEEMISYSKDIINKYNRIIIKFNSILLSLENNSKLSDADRVVLRDYWISYFREYELGYKVDILDRVNTLACNLRKFEFNGYSEEVVTKFISDCKNLIKKEMSTDKINREILTEIELNIYKPLEEKYLNKLDLLKTRINNINSNNDLTETEKDKQVSSLIIDFNVENGHKLDLDKKLEEMKRNLITLKYGGYGELEINSFNEHISDLILMGEEQKKSKKEVLVEMLIVYNNYLDKYKKLLSSLEEQLDIIKSNKDLSKKELEEKKQEKLQEFRDKMGHIINVQYRYTKMLEKLENNPKISDSVIDDFKSEYLEIINISNDSKIIMERLTLAFNIILADNTDKDSNTSLNINIETKNINDLINILIERLKTLPLGGYGDTVIDDFNLKCENIINEDSQLDVKIKKIEDYEKILEKYYNKNLEIFKRWSTKLIDNYMGRDKDLYIKKINNQVSYMLSLSESELFDYFMLDSKNKENDMIKHNLELKVKVLALEEEKNTNKVNLVNKKLDDLINNSTIPYTIEEIKNITKKVEELDLDSNLDTYHLMTIDEYIDSTLFQQIFMCSQELN